MPCYHPITAYQRINSDDRKVLFELPPGNVDGWQLHFQKLTLPCGKCIGCRLEYSRQWANRCVLESMMHPSGSSWFLTLTIDDDHLEDYVTKHGFATVRIKDLSEFVKRLRRHWEYHYQITNIRFFGCSEYGDQSMRPHYHMLVFGLPLFDLEKYKNNHQGDALWISRELESVWSKGLVTVAEFSWNTAAYTARYVMKKCKGLNKDVYADMDIEPEQVRMSRRPGIGLEYFEIHSDEIYRNDSIILPGGKVVRPPKYFDLKMALKDPALIERIKLDREQIGILRADAIDAQHGYDPMEYLAIQERTKEDSTRILLRST